MASYTDSQLNRLADRLRDGQDLTTQECINLVGDCQRLAVDLINMTEERDTLRAELATVKAALPRWRLQDGWTGGRGQCWRLGYVGVTDVGYNVFTVSYDHDTATLEEYRSGDYAAARRRAEVLLGLPPCEVCE
jgi:hypothetical protein